MRDMKRVVIVLIIAVILVLTLLCYPLTNGDENELTNENYINFSNNKVMGFGWVSCKYFFELDDWKLIIITDDGERYISDNIPEEFQVGYHEVCFAGLIINQSNNFIFIDVTAMSLKCEGLSVEYKSPINQFYYHNYTGV